MGISTNAILFYGFHAEECAWDDLIGDDWEARFAELSGLRAPAAEFGDDTKDKFISFWDKKRNIVGAELCEVDFHCSGDCSMPFVCVKASKTEASRGDPCEVESLEVKSDWREALEIFTKKMGIPWQEPHWWLVSYWST